MIANERQYKIARQQLARLRNSLKTIVAPRAKSQIENRALVGAEKAALKSQIESISAEIDDYEAMRAGAVEIPVDVGLAELPHTLIRARIVRGLSQRELAERIGLKEQQIQRYESQEYATASLSRLRRIADALGLRVAEVPKKETTAVEKKKEKETLDWSRFPVKEMYRRGWFPGFSGSLSEALRGAEDLVRDFVGGSMKAPIAALRRQKVRTGGQYDRYALIAWQCRVFSMAADRNLTVYRASNLDTEWFKRLIQTSQEQDGPIRARDYLAEPALR